MTYYYSERSQHKLDSCCQELQIVFLEALKFMDITIIDGHRNEQRQNDYYESGKSQVQFPNGKHNTFPSEAIDAAPYPIDWHDRERATLFAGFVLGIAAMKGILLRWGGDWNHDWQVKDNNFDDLWHFEVVQVVAGPKTRKKDEKENVVPMPSRIVSK
jgi:peptidoglycan L-alanyl-D-glutamate endopeptidase CwlK